VSKVRETALKVPHANAVGSISTSSNMLQIHAGVVDGLEKLGIASRAIVVPLD
jgi:hypothetical protein